MKVFIIFIFVSALSYGQVISPEIDDTQVQVKRGLSDALLISEYDCSAEELPEDYYDPGLSFYTKSLSSWALAPEVGIEVRNESTEVVIARESSYRSVRQVTFILDPSGVRIDEIHEITEKSVEEERNLGTISAPDYQTVLELIKNGKITCLAK